MNKAEKKAKKETLTNTYDSVTVVARNEGCLLLSLYYCSCSSTADPKNDSLVAPRSV